MNGRALPASLTVPQQEEHGTRKSPGGGGGGREKKREPTNVKMTYNSQQLATTLKCCPGRRHLDNLSKEAISLPLLSFLFSFSLSLSLSLYLNLFLFSFIYLIVFPLLYVVVAVVAAVAGVNLRTPACNAIYRGRRKVMQCRFLETAVSGNLRRFSEIPHPPTHSPLLPRGGSLR